MKCRKCEATLFTIQVIPCCDDCDQNPAYDTDKKEYIYDSEIIDQKELDRVGVEDDGECKMGTAFGAGCYLFTCSVCHHKEHLAVSDSCGY